MAHARLRIFEHILEVELAENAEEVMREYGEAISEKAKSIAPVLTGRYRDSIHYEQTGPMSGKVSTDAIDGQFHYSGLVESRHGTMQAASRWAK